MRSVPRFVLMLTWVAALVFTPAVHAAQDRPNILWIVAEDISPNLGCYGDAYATSPNIDKLAKEGVRYDYAFSNAGVCAIARTTLITGLYAPSIGTQFMRCRGPIPDTIRGYPSYLRDAGYFTTNHTKTDYNIADPPMKSMWDEADKKAHYKHRKPGQTFFAVFNIELSHESQLRDPAYSKNVRPKLSAAELHDPAKARVPAYMPDIPTVREDWAHYYDSITAMDKEVGRLLGELDKEGLADDTIVFFYGDHGGGMPRSKRWCYDSSTRVPLIIRFPKKWQHLAPAQPGGTTDRLVSFIDFGPTVISLAGAEPPSIMQGEAFLGKFAREPRQFVYNYRDRMDERYDLVRAVRDKKYNYIRNYHPELPWFHHQACDYNLQTPTTAAWQKLSEAGKLTGAPAIFMADSKPMEELYDVAADPDEIHNLASDADYAPVLAKMRTALRQWQDQVIDLGFIPEPELRSRFDEPPYAAVRDHPDSYPMGPIRDAADLAIARNPKSVPALTQLLDDKEPVVRYWAATGLLSLGDDAKPALAALSKAMSDANLVAAIPAAEAVIRLGGEADKARMVLAKALSDKNEWTQLMAANAIERLGPAGKGALQEAKDTIFSNDYVKRVISGL
ncbi:MAG: sulfatase-like hydrolase/transferase [Planctomycetes bacterium]|nr:sulfatase-like hydrolase/transferase [Planctomycetota bacterium]